jgi:hypothetical protein
MTADIKTPTVPIDRTTDAADHLVGLEDFSGDVMLGEHVCSGEARRPGAHDDDPRRVTLLHRAPSPKR